MQDTSDLLDEHAKRIADVDHKLERMVTEERMLIDRRTDGLYQRLARFGGQARRPEVGRETAARPGFARRLGRSDGRPPRRNAGFASAARQSMHRVHDPVAHGWDAKDECDEPRHGHRSGQTARQAPQASAGRPDSKAHAGPRCEDEAEYGKTRLVDPPANGGAQGLRRRRTVREGPTVVPIARPAMRTRRPLLKV